MSGFGVDLFAKLAVERRDSLLGANTLSEFAGEESGCGVYLQQKHKKLGSPQRFL
jgi:hypothetical protein